MSLIKWYFPVVPRRIKQLPEMSAEIKRCADPSVLRPVPAEWRFSLFRLKSVEGEGWPERLGIHFIIHLLQQC